MQTPFARDGISTAHKGATDRPKTLTITSRRPKTKQQAAGSQHPDRRLTTQRLQGSPMANDEFRAMKDRRRGSSASPTPIQELLAAEPAKKLSAKASSAQASDKLAAARFLLEEEPASAADAIAYVHTVLSQIGLPRSPQKERVWTRSNGGASLTVLAGGITSRDGTRVEQPLPQGPYARLILADISTYAVRHKTPVVPMERSVSAYMRERLHLFTGGGKRGAYTSFKREALALAAAHMELAVHHNGVYRQVKVPPISSFEAWTVDQGEQLALWPCELVLSHEFFESLRKHALPIDMRAYRALGHSSLAQDIYTWLAHRLPRLKAPLSLPWSVLAEQFGGYDDVKEFRKEFIRRLKEVSAVYPDAKFEVVQGRRGQVGGSLLLKPSSGPIPRVGTVLPATIGGSAVLGDPISCLREPTRGPYKPK
jgi:hypothetical protein